MKTYIRQLGTQDYKSVKDIYDDAFGADKKPASVLYRTWKNRSKELSLGIFNCTGELLGFTLVLDYYMSFIAVHSLFAGMGLGNILLQCILAISIDAGETLTLCPLMDVIPWYIRHGFSFTSSGEMVFHSHGTRRQSKYISAPR